jgi:hypothetical protein
VNGSRPSEARDRVLAQLPPEKQLEVMQRAEKRGPRPDDPDWLLVETMMACAARIEASAAKAESPALVDLTARLERIEKLVKQRIPQADPIPVIARYAAVFAGGFVFAEIIGMLLLNGWLPPAIDRFNAFGAGLSVTALVLVYLWLAPIVRGGRSG